jgi:hypothetical protein
MVTGYKSKYSNVDNLNNLDVQLVLMKCKQTVRIRISET